MSEIWPELTDQLDRCTDTEKFSELQEAFDSLDAAKTASAALQAGFGLEPTLKVLSAEEQ